MITAIAMVGIAVLLLAMPKHRTPFVAFRTTAMVEGQSVEIEGRLRMVGSRFEMVDVRRVSDGALITVTKANRLAICKEATAALAE